MDTNQMFEYLREDMKRIEGKIDSLADNQLKATSALVAHTEEDHRNFEAIHLDIQAIQVKASVLDNVKKTNWDRVTAVLAILISIGTALVMQLHK